VPQQLLTIGGSSIDNQGVLEIAPGAILGISSNFSLPGLGTLINNGGSVAILGRLDNTGQPLAVSRPYEFFLNGTINGGTVAGPGYVYVPYIAQATLSNLTFNSTLVLNGDVTATNVTGTGTINISNPEAIEGSGNVYMETVPSGITVRGGIERSFDEPFPGGFYKAYVFATTNQGRIRAERFGGPGRLTIAGALTNAGTLEVSPDDTLIVQGDLTFTQDARLVVDGGGLLEVQGNLNLSSLSDFLEVLPRADGVAYDNQLIATYTGTQTGTFSGRTPGILIQYSTALKQIRISGTPVPEPSSVGLMIGLLGGLACRRRRRLRG
jgi:hypothetical protein